MSQHHADSVQDNDKGNPVQVAVAVTAGAIGLVIAIILIAYFAVGTHRVGSSEAKANTPEAIAERIAPLSTLKGPGGAEPGAPAAAPVKTAQVAPPAVSAPASGESVYKSACLACHAAGVAGAPKLGDKAAWGPRIAKGKPLLHEHAIKGFNAMPAKGGNTALADADVKAAVEYMLAQAK